MEKKNKIILIAIILICILIVGFCIFAILNNNENKSDAEKFRNEYTKLNNKTNEFNNLEYVHVSLSKSNTFKYIDEEKAVQLMKEDTGIIYFGFPECPWCRSLVTTLGSVSEKVNETIYYLNVKDIRSTYAIEDNSLKKTKEGTTGYYKILDVLDSKLEDYYLTDSEGNKFDTEEKRLYAPTLISFKDGKITDFHVGTVDSQESGYDKLNEEQLKELESIVKRVLNSTKDIEVCTEDKC